VELLGLRRDARARAELIEQFGGVEVLRLGSPSARSGAGTMRA
jgi:hypothetical protein